MSGAGVRASRSGAESESLRSGAVVGAGARVNNEVHTGGQDEEAIRCGGGVMKLLPHDLDPPITKSLSREDLDRSDLRDPPGVNCGMHRMRWLSRATCCSKIDLGSGFALGA